MTTDYTLHGKLVTHIKQGTNDLHILYDAQSRPTFLDLNGTTYTCVHNLQGDIVALLDETNAKVVEYHYDAWGKPTGTWTLTTAYEELARLNPFRYRGYVYDEETGLYYLRSRYYNPEWGRFVNADGVLGDRGNLIAHNIFAYCVNAPIFTYDPTGKAAESGFSLKYNHENRSMGFMRILAGLRWLEFDYFNASGGKEWKVPQISFLSLKSNKVEFVDYSVSRKTLNAEGKVVGDVLTFIGEDSAGDAVTYALGSVGVAVNGAWFSELASGLGDIWGIIGGDVSVEATVHRARYRYEFPESHYSAIVDYVFYAGVGDGMNPFDGVTGSGTVYMGAIPFGIIQGIR